MLPRLISILGMAAALHAAPAIRDLSPRGARQGATFTLYLRGEALAQGAQIRSTLPATFSHLVRSKDPLADSNAGAMRPDSVLPLLVSIKPGAPTGLYPIRVVTPGGISNVVLFAVGDLTEIDEAEAKDPRQPNDFLEQAQKVETGVAISGTLAGVDQDHYRFRARAGQKLVFEVEARRAGSAIDPAIEIFDSTGREIARNDDAESLGVDSRVEVGFEKAGDYVVRLHDSRFSEQAQNFYRLKIGSWQFASGVFPLGGKRGETAEVTLFGGNLPRPVKVRADFHSKSDFVPVRLPSSGALPLWLEVNDLPEAMGPESAAPLPLPESTVMNGRIAKAGDIDRYKLAVKPGESWVFEVHAASLGLSSLDAVITLRDSAGKKLAAGDDGNGVDPLLAFTVPAGVSEITLEVEDLLGRGGPQYGYRLRAARQHADFSVELASPFVNVPAGGTAAVAVAVQRRGYSGALKVRITNLPEGFTAAGGHVPPEAAAQRFTNEITGRTRERSVITITALPGVRPQSLDLEVVGEAVMPDGTLIGRTARGPGMQVAVRGVKEKTFTAPWLDMQLPMAVTAPPPVRVTSSTPHVRIAQGFEYVLDYKVSKAGVKVNQQTAGSVGNLRILKGAESAYLISTNFATPTTMFDMLLEAQAEVDGKPVSVPTPAITFEVVPGYEINMARDLRLAPGGKLEVPGEVRRELTFEGGEIRIRAEDLPDHVSCLEVAVPAGQAKFTLACTAAAAAKPGAFDVRIASSAPDTGRKQKAEYKIPDLSAKLTVRP